MDLKSKKVRDFTKPGSAKSCLPETLVRDVITTLKQEKIGSIVVTDKSNKVLGIFTERDYLMKVALEADDFLDHAVSEFMTKDPKSVYPDDPIYRAALFMRVGHFRHIVVKDKDESLDSVLSVKDVMDYIIDAA